jgi:rhodanese-related sulfurtransferase
MIKKIILGVLIMITTSLADVKSIDAIKLQEMMKEGIVVIDIRRDDEYKYFGIIKGSHKLTFFDEKGEYDINEWVGGFTKLVTSQEQPFVLICAHANRTKVVGDMLSNQAVYKNVYDLKGGINYGWIDKGLKTIK